MRQTNQDTPAGMIQPSQFDTILPKEARTELLRPRRPAILGLPIYQPPNRSGVFKWVGGFAVVVILLIGTITNNIQRKAPAASQPDPVLQHSREILQQPTPAPTTLPPGNASRWKEYLANNPPAPRAVLLTPAPRATLVKLPPPPAREAGYLPPLVPGRQYRATMPYNLEVLTTYRGGLASLAMLPQDGNRLGDMWVIGRTPWVWIWAPGASHADWIDP